MLAPSARIGQWNEVKGKEDRAGDSTEGQQNKLRRQNLTCDPFAAVGCFAF